MVKNAKKRTTGTRHHIGEQKKGGRQEKAAMTKNAKTHNQKTAKQMREAAMKRGEEKNPGRRTRKCATAKTAAQRIGHSGGELPK